MDKLKEYLSFLKGHRNLVKPAAIVIILIAAAVFFGTKGEKDEISVQLPEEQNQVEAAEMGDSQPDEDADTLLYVDISGEVKSPGVYQVKEGTRLFEVIEMAGGLSKEADIDSFNQAEMVADGEKVIIPAKGEAVTVTGDGAFAASGSTGKENGLININTADADTLQEIPGVGPSTADKIISYRTENGPFSSKEDIKNVSGIGDKTYDKMKDMITT